MGQAITPVFDTEAERIKEQLAQADALRKVGMAGNTGSGYHGGRVFIVGNPLGNIASGIAGAFLGDRARTRQGELEQQQTQARQDWLSQMPKSYEEKTQTEWNGGQPMTGDASAQTPALPGAMSVTDPNFLKQDFTAAGPTGAPTQSDQQFQQSIAATPHERVTTQTPISPLQQAKAMQEWAMQAPRGMEGVQQFALQQALTAPQREAEAAQKREDRLQELRLKAMDLRASQAERLEAQKEIARMNIEGRKEVAGLVASLKASGKAGDGAVDQDAADLIAARFIEGDKNALMGISRNKALHGAVMASIARQAKEQGVDAKELVMRGLEYSGATAEQRTVGNQAANVVMAGSEAYNMVPIVSDLSKKVSRTDFPTINSAGNVIRKQSGDPNVVAFDQSIDSLINAYARAINPKGVATVADKKRAHEKLNTAFTNGQVDAVLGVMKQEIEAAKAAPVEARKLSREARVGGGEPTPAKPAAAKLSDEDLLKMYGVGGK